MKEWLVYVDKEKTVRVSASRCVRGENTNWLIFVNDNKEPVGVFDVRKIAGWVNVKNANVNHVKKDEPASQKTLAH